MELDGDVRTGLAKEKRESLFHGGRKTSEGAVYYTSLAQEIHLSWPVVAWLLGLYDVYATGRTCGKRGLKRILCS
jgi:hypothetical protein